VWGPCNGPSQEVDNKDHLILSGGPGAYRTFMARTLEAAGETAAATVAQVTRPLTEAIRVAV